MNLATQFPGAETAIPYRALSCELPMRANEAPLALRGLHRVKPHAGMVQTLEATSPVPRVAIVEAS